jgi:hypothetical protein
MNRLPHPPRSLEITGQINRRLGLIATTIALLLAGSATSTCGYAGPAAWPPAPLVCAPAMPPPAIVDIVTPPAQPAPPVTQWRHYPLVPHSTSAQTVGDAEIGKGWISHDVYVPPGAEAVVWATVYKKNKVDPTYCLYTRIRGARTPFKTQVSVQRRWDWSSKGRRYQWVIRVGGRQLSSWVVNPHLGNGAAHNFAGERVDHVRLNRSYLLWAYLSDPRQAGGSGDLATRVKNHDTAELFLIRFLPLDEPAPRFDPAGCRFVAR